MFKVRKFDWTSVVRVRFGFTQPGSGSVHFRQGRVRVRFGFAPPGSDPDRGPARIGFGIRTRGLGGVQIKSHMQIRSLVTGHVAMGPRSTLAAAMRMCRPLLSCIYAARRASWPLRPAQSQRAATRATAAPALIRRAPSPSCSSRSMQIAVVGFWFGPWSGAAAQPDAAQPSNPRAAQDLASELKRGSLAYWDMTRVRGVSKYV